MLRPPTHDDPNAIPRNGTEVPWVDLPEPRPEHGRERRSPGNEPEGTAAGERRRRSAGR